MKVLILGSGVIGVVRVHLLGAGGGDSGSSCGWGGSDLALGVRGGLSDP